MKSKRYLILALAAASCGAGAFAQSAIDAFRFAQPDMKGTARFMSMGGAFGALGGDLSTLSQNPAGIGVYRTSEIGFTLDLDLQKSSSNAQGQSVSFDNTHFYLNNIGGVLTLKLPSSSCPNINFGFTYNKTTSYNRHYGGAFGRLDNSMTNYIAGLANANSLTVGDVSYNDSGFDPYNPNDGGITAPWLATLAYNSYLINAEGDPDYPTWTGQWGDRTAGSANFEVEERGSVDSYNIAVGGNIANVVYWGMDFDITSLSYSTNTYWRENMTNAYVDLTGTPQPTDSEWSLRNSYAVSGTGFNYKLGFIVKPIQELRLGFAFHTPTWYTLNEQFVGSTRYRYAGKTDYSTEYTNDGFPGENSMRFHTPWRIIASAAGVVGGKFIISADYEWANYGGMRFSDPSYAYYDWNVNGSYNSYAETNNDIQAYYKDTNTLRLGAEYRITPQFSARVGYSFVSSPVSAEAKDGRTEIWTAGTMPEYRFDNTTNYITCGLGYRIQKFYIDLAYVYKHMNSTYHAYTGDPDNPQIQSPQASVNFNNSQIVLSAGFKF